MNTCILFLLATLTACTTGTTQKPDGNPVDDTDIVDSDTVDTDTHEETDTLPEDDTADIGPMGGEIVCVTDPTRPDEDNLLGETTGNRTSVFRCDSSGEEGIITRLSVTNCDTSGADLDGDCADPGERWGAWEAIASVAITYFDRGGVRQTATTTYVDGVATFGGLELYIEENGSALITVTEDIGPVTDGTPPEGTSGDRTQTNLDLTGTRGEAIGLTSGQPMSFREHYALGERMTLRHTEPTITHHALSPAGVIQVGGERGEKLRYVIAADARGGLGVEGILFSMVSTDARGYYWNTCDNLGNPEKWGVFLADDLSTPLDDDRRWEFLDTTGNACRPGGVVGYGFRRFEPAVWIGAGEAQAFSVYVDSRGASHDMGDVIMLGIPDQATAQSFGFPAIEWTDGYAVDIDGRYLQLPLRG